MNPQVIDLANRIYDIWTCCYSDAVKDRIQLAASKIGITMDEMVAIVIADQISQQLEDQRRSITFGRN